MHRGWLLLALLLTGQGLAASSIMVVGRYGDGALLKIDGTVKVVAKGQTVEGVRLLGADQAGAEIEVNGIRRRLPLGVDYRPGLLRPTTEVSVQVNAYNQYVTTGTINGRVVQFLVDTGANTVSLSASEARRIGIDYRLGDQGRSLTAGGTIGNYLVRLPVVRVGAIEVRNVEATVREVDDPMPILLGMSFLQHVTIQHERGLLRLIQHRSQ